MTEEKGHETSAVGRHEKGSQGVCTTVGGCGAGLKGGKVCKEMRKSQRLDHCQER